MLSLFLGLVWALRAPLRVVLWGIPYWHAFLPPFSLSLELFFLFWHVPLIVGGLLAHFGCQPNLCVTSISVILRIMYRRVRRQT